ncbi:MAG: class I SAM-dependent methyltransferase [Verrucomicrobiota bacterium]|jgi:SAM-dependent methyltransferase
MTSLPEYYSRRAPEYEQMWYRDEPARQAEQKALRDAMVDWLRHRRVLEVACGTGYWTQFLVGSAEHVVAVDASETMLALARAKKLPAEFVDWQTGDAYALRHGPQNFTGGLANFWFSHVPKSRVSEFLDAFHARLEPKSHVFLADNVFVPGVGGELIVRPDCEDTFKLRQLADGSRHEVLKNYYDHAALQAIFSPHASALAIEIGTSFWWVRYILNSNSPATTSS